jgi:hypothetical protein
MSIHFTRQGTLASKNLGYYSSVPSPCQGNRSFKSAYYRACNITPMLHEDLDFLMPRIMFRLTPKVTFKLTFRSQVNYMQRSIRNMEVLI